MNQGPIRIVDEHGVHPDNLDHAVTEQRLFKEGRLVTLNTNGMVFVFGSNEGGHHGAGAARYAFNCKGAEMGKSFGLYGQSFAIPTKDSSIRHTLPLGDIRRYVQHFLNFARQHPQLIFQITCIGCGLAGLKHEQVAPMFYLAPSNCLFDTDWEEYLPVTAKFWGHF